MKSNKHLILQFIFCLVACITGSLPAAADQPYLPGSLQTYIVLYKSNAVPPNAPAMVANAGGTLLYTYDAIGVAIAQSDNTLFTNNVMLDKKIDGVSSTTNFGIQLNDDIEIATDTALLAAPVADADPFFSQQWDMVQIHVPEAHAITGGSPTVVVGDIDTGLDYTHPDLAANVDFSNSVSCVGGVPNQDPAAWKDDNGHGTLTAGIIAAAANGIGIIGVAPNVRIAGIKASNAAGYIFPEAVICAFMWTADHNINVTNNSYFADPWLFNCRNDPEQRAIWKAEQRAIRYAMSKGVVVVAAQGNQNMDLSKQNVDTISPDYPPGSEITREVTNACLVIPVEIPGVIGVTANGNLMQKAYYSSYGVGVSDVVAPGGDALFQLTTAAPNGRVLSTYLGNGYAFAQGTSMAAPHVAGVAALILSQFGSMPQGAVQAMITNTADPQDCPPNPFDPSGTGTYLATCEGGAGYNNFYGHGQINAFSAVTKTP